MLSAIIPVFVPTSWMIQIHELLGLGEFPQAPIVEYLTRSISLLYCVHGGLLFVISLDANRYWPLIKMIAFLHFGFGIVITGIGIFSKLPVLWIVGEGPMIAIFGIVIFGFWKMGSSATREETA